LRAKLITTRDEKALYELEKNARILEKLFNVKLTSYEVDYLVQNKSQFKAKKFKRFLKTNYKRHRLVEKNEYDIGYVIRQMDTAIEFYNIAQKRNNAMLNNTLKRMAGEDQEIAALVTGGFHTGGLTDLMKNNGLSYLVVMPKFEKGKARPYIAILTNKKSSYEELIEKGEYELAIHQFFSTGDVASYLYSIALTLKEVEEEKLDSVKTIWGENYKRDYERLPEKRRQSLAAGRFTPHEFKNILVQSFDRNTLIKLKAIGDESLTKDMVLSTINYQGPRQLESREDAPDAHKQIATELVHMYMRSELEEHEDGLKQAELNCGELRNIIENSLREAIYIDVFTDYKAGADAKIYKNGAETIIIKDLNDENRDVIFANRPIDGYQLARQRLGGLATEFIILPNLTVRVKEENGTISEHTIKNAVVQKMTPVLFKEDMYDPQLKDRRYKGVLAESIESGDTETAKELIEKFIINIRDMLSRGVFNWDIKTENYGYDPFSGQIGIFDASKSLEAKDIKPEHGRVFLNNLILTKNEIYNWTKTALNEKDANMLGDYFAESVKRAFSAEGYIVNISGRGEITDVTGRVRELEAQDDFSEVIICDLMRPSAEHKAVTYIPTEEAREFAINEVTQYLATCGVNIKNMQKIRIFPAFQKTEPGQDKPPTAPKKAEPPHAFRVLSKWPLLGGGIDWAIIFGTITLADVAYLALKGAGLSWTGIVIAGILGIISLMFFVTSFMRVIVSMMAIHRVHPEFTFWQILTHDIGHDEKSLEELREISLYAWGQIRRHELWEGGFVGHILGLVEFVPGISLMTKNEVQDSRPHITFRQRVKLFKKMKKYLSEEGKAYLEELLKSVRENDKEALNRLKKGFPSVANPHPEYFNEMQTPEIGFEKIAEELACLKVTENCSHGCKHCALPSGSYVKIMPFYRIMQLLEAFLDNTNDGIQNRFSALTLKAPRDFGTNIYYEDNSNRLGQDGITLYFDNEAFDYYDPLYDADLGDVIAAVMFYFPEQRIHITTRGGYLGDEIALRAAKKIAGLMEQEYDIDLRVSINLYDLPRGVKHYVKRMAEFLDALQGPPITLHTVCDSKNRYQTEDVLNAIVKRTTNKNVTFDYERGTAERLFTVFAIGRGRNLPSDNTNDIGACMYGFHIEPNGIVKRNSEIIIDDNSSSHAMSDAGISLWDKKEAIPAILPRKPRFRNLFSSSYLIAPIPLAFLAENTNEMSILQTFGPVMFIIVAIIAVGLAVKIYSHVSIVPLTKDELKRGLAVMILKKDSETKDRLIETFFKITQDSRSEEQYKSEEVDAEDYKRTLVLLAKFEDIKLSALIEEIDLRKDAQRLRAAIARQKEEMRKKAERENRKKESLDGVLSREALEVLDSRILGADAVIYEHGETAGLDLADEEVPSEADMSKEEIMFNKALGRKGAIGSSGDAIMKDVTAKGAELTALGRGTEEPEKPRGGGVKKALKIILIFTILRLTASWANAAEEIATSNGIALFSNIWYAIAIIPVVFLFGYAIKDILTPVKPLKPIRLPKLPGGIAIGITGTDFDREIDTSDLGGVNVRGLDGDSEEENLKQLEEFRTKTGAYASGLIDIGDVHAKGLKLRDVLVKLVHAIEKEDALHFTLNPEAVPIDAATLRQMQAMLARVAERLPVTMSLRTEELSLYNYTWKVLSNKTSIKSLTDITNRYIENNENEKRAHLIRINEPGELKIQAEAHRTRHPEKHELKVMLALRDAKEVEALQSPKAIQEMLEKMDIDEKTLKADNVIVVTQDTADSYSINAIYEEYLSDYRPENIAIADLVKKGRALTAEDEKLLKKAVFVEYEGIATSLVYDITLELMAHKKLDPGIPYVSRKVRKLLWFTLPAIIRGKEARQLEEKLKQYRKILIAA